MAYRDKYLKYKKKYLELQNKLYGGTVPKEIISTEDQLKKFNEIMKQLAPLMAEQIEDIYDYVFDLITCNKVQLSWDNFVECFPHITGAPTTLLYFLKQVQSKMNKLKEQTNPVKRIIKGLYENATLPKNENIYKVAYNRIMEELFMAVFNMFFNHTPGKIAYATNSNFKIFLNNIYVKHDIQRDSLYLTKDEFTEIMTREFTDEITELNVNPNYTPAKK